MRKSSGRRRRGERWKSRRRGDGQWEGKKQRKKTKEDKQPHKVTLASRWTAANSHSQVHCTALGKLAERASDAAGVTADLGRPLWRAAPRWLMMSERGSWTLRRCR